MYSDTVTIFCRYESRLGDTWYPKIIRGCHLNMDKSAIIAKYGAETQDNAMLNIRFSVDDLHDGEPQCKQIPWLDGKKIVIADQIWLPPNQWDAQVNDDLQRTITFEDGSAFDFFWFGEWTGATVIYDDDYAVDEGFYGFMNRTQDYVFAITAVGGPYTVIPHFELMGR